MQVSMVLAQRQRRLRQISKLHLYTQTQGIDVQIKNTIFTCSWNNLEQRDLPIDRMFHASPAFVDAHVMTEVGDDPARHVLFALTRCMSTARNTIGDSCAGDTTR